MYLFSIPGIEWLLILEFYGDKNHQNRVIYAISTIYRPSCSYFIKFGVYRNRGLEGKGEEQRERDSKRRGTPSKPLGVASRGQEGLDGRAMLGACEGLKGCEPRGSRSDETPGADAEPLAMARNWARKDWVSQGTLG
jgi:hypothetical protein